MGGLLKSEMDWSGIDKLNKQALEHLASGLRTSLGKTAEMFLQVCASVARIHDRLAELGCRGRFSSFVESECGISRSTAYNYIAIHNKFRNCPTVGQFTPSALLELAKSDTPDEVIEQLIASDEHVSGAKAKAAKRKAKTVLEIPNESATVFDDEMEYEDIPDDEPEPTAKAVRERVESRKDQARQTRQQVKDSEAAERERIERWAETIDTFENKVIAIKAAIDRLDKQQFAVVQMMFE